MKCGRKRNEAQCSLVHSTFLPRASSALTFYIEDYWFCLPDPISQRYASNRHSSARSDSQWAL